MNQNLYTIFDNLSETAGPIWTAQNDKVAVRNFQNHIIESKVTHADDFQLYAVGSFDFNTMMIDPEASPRKITEVPHA